VKLRYLVLCAIGTLPAGCAAVPPDSTEAPPLGYLYHDANHPSSIAQPSPQAIENAKHGVWLWPPAASIRAS